MPKAICTYPIPTERQDVFAVNIRGAVLFKYNLKVVIWIDVVCSCDVVCGQALSTILHLLVGACGIRTSPFSLVVVTTERVAPTILMVQCSYRQAAAAFTHILPTATFLSLSFYMRYVEAADKRAPSQPNQFDSSDKMSV
jgi:hypothetical protein